MMDLASGILGFGLKIFGFFLDRASSDMATKQRFLDFVNKWVGAEQKPADLSISYYAQIQAALKPKEEPKP